MQTEQEVKYEYQTIVTIVADMVVSYLERKSEIDIQDPGKVAA